LTPYAPILRPKTPDPKPYIRYQWKLFRTLTTPDPKPYIRYQWKLFYNLCSSGQFLTNTFIDTFLNSRLLTPNILPEAALTAEVK